MKIAQINNSLKDLYEIRPLRIYIEIIVYALVGWGSFVFSVYDDNFWALIPAGIFLYRGHAFVHEISHLYYSVPFARHLYNHLLGYINHIPAYTMKTHKFHHSIMSFGKIDDPEYEAWTMKSKLMLFRPLVFALFFPIAITIRFGIWPLINYFLPKARQMKTFQKASSVVMNIKYKRPYKEDDFNEVLREDLWCSFYFILSLSLVVYFGLFQAVAFKWYIIMVCVQILNTYRALVAHRYQIHKSEHTDRQLQQLEDSVTIEGNWLTELWAPVGLRYHSTHHLLPNLPYYSLRKAHYRLKKDLPKDHPYHQTIEKSFIAAFSKLFNNCQQV